MNKPNKVCYLVFNDEHKHGIVLDKYSQVAKLKQPRTYQLFPSELKAYLKQLLIADIIRINSLN